MRVRARIRLGTFPPVDKQRRARLESLLAACDRALVGLPEPDDPFVGRLLSDVERLRAEVWAELGEDPEEIQQARR
jgi:hypothetical protein